MEKMAQKQQQQQHQNLLKQQNHQHENRTNLATLNTRNCLAKSKSLIIQSQNHCSISPVSVLSQVINNPLNQAISEREKSISSVSPLHSVPICSSANMIGLQENNMIPLAYEYPVTTKAQNYSSPQSVVVGAGPGPIEQDGNMLLQTNYYNCLSLATTTKTTNSPNSKIKNHSMDELETDDDEDDDGEDDFDDTTDEDEEEEENGDGDVTGDSSDELNKNNELATKRIRLNGRFGGAYSNENVDQICQELKRNMKSESSNNGEQSDQNNSTTNEQNKSRFNWLGECPA